MNLKRKKIPSKSNLRKRKGATPKQNSTSPASSPGSALAKLASISAYAKVKMSDKELKANAGFFAAKSALTELAEELKKRSKKTIPPPQK
jgi:hypothetical protein